MLLIMIMYISNHFICQHGTSLMLSPSVSLSGDSVFVEYSSQDHWSQYTILQAAIPDILTNVPQTHFENTMKVVEVCIHKSLILAYYI